MNPVDLDFLSAACPTPAGWRRALVPFRRGMRKLMKPLLLHQIIVFEQLVAAIGRVEERQRTVEQRVESLEESLRKTDENHRRAEERQTNAEECQRQAEGDLKKTDATLEAVCARQDAFVADVQSMLALGWDHVALLRRLAVLEDRVEQLMQESEAQAAHQSGRVGTSAKVA